MTQILPIVIGVVKNDQGEILLGRRYQPEIPDIHGKWNLLGGRIEFGESPEDTIIREIKEECGLDIEVIRMLPKVFTKFRTKSDGTQIQILPISFECLVVGGNLDKNVSDPGVSELKFFHHQSLPLQDLMTGEELIIQLAVDK